MPRAVWFYWCERYRLGESIETESRSVVGRVWGEGGIRLLKGMGFLSRWMKMF